MSWQIGFGSDIGGRPEQQDSVSVLQYQNSYLLVVADGMGGAEFGAQASDAVIETAQTRFYSPHRGHPEKFLKRLCMDAHRRICRITNQCGVSGSTVVFLYLEGKKAYWTHVGDSRLYHFRRGQMVFHTQDHSMRYLKNSDLLKKGQVVHSNELYMCLGGENTIEPEFNASIVEEGDVFLLCSDGFWHLIKPKKVLEQLAVKRTIQEQVDTLLSMAVEKGGRKADNISLILARYEPDRNFWSSLKFWRK